METSKRAKEPKNKLGSAKNQVEARLLSLLNKQNQKHAKVKFRNKK